MKDTQMTITQEDREAAQNYWADEDPKKDLKEHFAAHRIAAEQRIVEWLRGLDHHLSTDYAAKAIESGEHLPRFVRVPHIGEAS